MARSKIDNRAASFARTAQNRFNELKHSLQAAEQSLAGLHKALRVPVIRPPRGRIPGTRTHISPLESAGLSSLSHLFSREIISGGADLFGGGDSFGNFEQSAGQFAGKLFDSYMRGQRIR